MLTIITQVDVKQPLASTEFVFIVDRSGSMSGSPWQACAASLQIFLRSIPQGIVIYMRNDC